MAYQYEKVNQKLLVPQIEDQLMMFIQQEQIEIGSKLPSEYKLAEKFGVGRSTIREAAKSLVSKGILDVKRGAGTFVKSKEIIITKKNKKGKKVEVDIRPMIRNFDLVSLDDNRVTFVSTIATGSKANLNINILIPQILDMLNLDMDPREVGVLRRDLYKVEDGQLVTPL